MTFAQRMVEKFETLLTEAVGLKTVTVNGTTTTYDDLQRQYQFWLGRVAREAGSPRIVRLDLSQQASQ